MNIDKLFRVLVVTGASSTVGIVAAACGSDKSGTDEGTGGTTSTGGSSSTTGGSASTTGGSTSTGGGSDTDAGSGMCAAVCKPEAVVTTWIDCNGCCCWLPAGTMVPSTLTAICGEEPCCIGRGRTK